MTLLRVNIVFDVVDNTIISKIGVQVSASLYVGKIIMDYAFKDKRMEVTNIIFEKFKNPEIFK